jgi:hypothetical protein
MHKPCPRPLGHGPGEPVEFGADEGVSVADGSEGLVQAGPVAVAASEPVIEVDPVWRYAQLGELLPLGGEVLAVGGAPGVADERCHVLSVRNGAVSVTMPADGPNGQSQIGRAMADSECRQVSGGRSPNGRRSAPRATVIVGAVNQQDVGPERRLFGMMQHLLFIAAQHQLPEAAPSRGVVTQDDALDAVLQVAAVIDEATRAGWIPAPRGVHAAAMLMVVRDYIRPLPFVPDDDRTTDKVAPDLAGRVAALRREGGAEGVHG